MDQAGGLHSRLGRRIRALGEGQSVQPTYVRRVLLTSCLLVGCTEKNVVRPCDLWTSSAVISGQVTNSSGAPIVGAVVDVQVATTGPCDTAVDWAQFRQDTTDASGNYSAQLEIGNSNGIRCVRVTEVGSGTTMRDEVEFVGGCYETRPPGQLNVDLVIPVAHPLDQ